MNTCDMESVLYIHGFNSSPSSFKAQQTSAWLTSRHQDINFTCPVISPFPNVAMQQLDAAIATLNKHGNVGLVGSSMGGFYATWLAEKYGYKAVLINPAVAPWQGRDYLLGGQQNYHTGEVHHIKQQHLDELERFEVATLSQPSRLLVLVQSGDEVLDYRQAVLKYADCQVVVEQGGDHGFQNYQNHLPDIMRFLMGSP